MASKRNMSELRGSFSERTEAHAFARLVAAVTRDVADVRPMFNPISNDPMLKPDGVPMWWRVAVPSRMLARAEDLRVAWDARQAFTYDSTEASHWESTFVTDDARVARSADYISTYGLSDAERAFLAAAAAGGTTPWDHASSAVAAGKRLGYVRPLAKASKRDGVRYELTDTGREALATDERVQAIPYDQRGKARQ